MSPNLPQSDLTNVRLVNAIARSYFTLQSGRGSNFADDFRGELCERQRIAASMADTFNRRIDMRPTLPPPDMADQPLRDAQPLGDGNLRFGGLQDFENVRLGQFGVCVLGPSVNNHSASGELVAGILSIGAPIEMLWVHAWRVVATVQGQEFARSRYASDVQRQVSGAPRDIINARGSVAFWAFASGPFPTFIIASFDDAGPECSLLLVGDNHALLVSYYLMLLKQKIG